MPPVFGREQDLSHPYQEALQQWQSLRRSLALRAMARNVRHDHRVSPEREADFQAFASKLGTDLDLHNAIVQYHKERIRFRPDPEFLNRTINESNLIILPNDVFPSEDTELVRVLDLSGLNRVFAWAKKKERWKPKFVELENPNNDTIVYNWLKKNLPEQVKEQARNFIGFILEVLNDSQIDQPFQPVWATTWKAFTPYKDCDPQRWVQLLGVRKEQPSCLVLLKYTVKEAGTLVRPTQLEAGWYECHFPSPPTARLEIGGHPMDLQLPPKIHHTQPAKTQTPLPEYLHKQIKHPPQHLLDWGFVEFPKRQNLRLQRIAHHQKLVKHYGDEVHSWMSAST